MHQYGIIVSVLLLGLFLAVAGCTQQTPPPVITTLAPVGTTPATPAAPQAITAVTNETLVAFVERAATFAKTEGSEKALAEFNKPNSSFVQGELYIYAYGFNGTTLAHPVNPETVGRVREGNLGIFVREMGGVVKNGSGFYRFTYINPLHNNTLESKLGYGVRVDNDWWLGSGIYTGPVNPVPPASPAATPAS